MTVARKTRARMRTASRVIRASYQGPKHRSLFDDVQAYCLFIGYPRSGHTLVGSLLNAHPNIVIANELDALRYLRVRWVGRAGLFWLILGRDREFSEKGRRWTGYNYAVPNQWQGRFDRLLVVGDKEGRGSTLRLARDPDLLHRLRRTTGTVVKIVHVIRNPFDNIATMHSRGYGALSECAEAYFSMCRTNKLILHRDDSQVLDLRHEDLIDRPEACLAELCEFLGVETTTEFLADCATIIHASPHRSREEVFWSPDLIEKIQNLMSCFSFLEGYTFDD